MATIPHSHPRRNPAHNGAFTLETIIVICIVAILVLVVVSGMSTLFTRNALSSAEFTLRQAMRGAQQLAMAKNTLVTVVAEDGAVIVSPANAVADGRTIALPKQIVVDKKVTLVFHPVGTVTVDKDPLILRHRNDTGATPRATYGLTATGQLKLL